MSASKFFYHHDRLLGTGRGKHAAFESVGRAAIIRLKGAGNIALAAYEAGTCGVALISGRVSIAPVDLAKCA